MNSQKIKIYLALLIAAVFWGLSFIWTKEVLEVYKPIIAILLRLIMSSVLLLIIGFVTRKLQKIRRCDIKYFFFLALFEPLLYFLGENIGLSYVTSTVAAVIVSTIPLFSAVAAFYFFKERLSILNIIGIVISVFGVVLVILKDDLTITTSIIGILFLILAVLAAVGYSISIKQIPEQYNVFTIVTVQNSIGIFYFIPFFMLFEYDSLINIVPTLDVILALVKLSIFASSVAFMLFTYSIKKIGITKANSFANLVPVFTAIFAYFVLDEKLLLINIIGMFAVIGGLFIAQAKFQNASIKSSCN